MGRDRCRGPHRRIVPILALASLALAIPCRGFTPAWKEGTSWTVATAYRATPLGKSKEGDEPRRAIWSPRTNWLFKVVGVHQDGDSAFYHVQVKDREGQSASLASLVFARLPGPEGKPSLVLLRGHFLSSQARRKLAKDLTFNEEGAAPVPVIAEQSTIPYDLPAFPLPDPSSDEKRQKRTFSITQELDSFLFARDIVQEDSLGLDPRRFAGNDLASKSGFPDLTPRHMVFVVMTRQFDSAEVRQIWSPWLPWFLYSETDTTRSWLIYHSDELRHQPRDHDDTTPRRSPRSDQ